MRQSSGADLGAYTDEAHARPAHVYISRASAAQITTIIGHLEAQLQQHRRSELIRVQLGALMWMSGPDGGVTGSWSGPILSDDLDELLAVAMWRHRQVSVPPRVVP